MKKLNKFFAVLVALAMMAVMCVTAAFAAEENENAEPAAPAATTAPLTKTLTIPAGTDIPTDASATFKFDLVSINGGSVNTDNDILGESHDGVFTIDLAHPSGTPDTENNTDTYTYTIANVLAGANFTAPGVYEWTVEETGFTIDNENSNAVKEKDNDKFTLAVKVVNGENGLEVGEVSVKDGADDSDTESTSAENGLSFQNTYYRRAAENAGLKVQKTVEGDLGDQNTPFEITITLNAPAIDGANAIEATKTTAEGTTAFALPADGKVNLKHGEYITFTKIAVGTKYTVEETDTRKDNEGKDPTKYTAQNEVTTAAAVTDTLDSVNIINTLNSQNEPITGILISNLPYIALALVAVGGLVAYVVVRRKNEENA